MQRILTNRWVHIFLLLCIVFFSSGLIKADHPLRKRMQLIVFDTYLKNHPRDSKGDVSVIDIDNQSLVVLGQWPWPRTVMAELIDNLRTLGAHVIAFDGVLAESDRTSPKNFLQVLPEIEQERLLKNYQELSIDNDQVLAESIKNHGRFISGFTHGISPHNPKLKTGFLAKEPIRKHFLNNAFPFDRVARFMPALENAAAGNGSFMALPEIDNVIRRTPLVFTDKKRKNLYPALGLEAIRLNSQKPSLIFLQENESFSDISLNNFYQIKIADKVIPIDEDAYIWIHFREGHEKAYVPAFKILDSKFHNKIKEKIVGKIVYIASSAEGLKDLRSTPLGLLPGVEIHVNATEQILADQYLSRPSSIIYAENAFIAVAGLAFVFLTPFVNLYIRLVMVSSSIVGCFGFSYSSFLGKGLLVDPVYPGFAIGLIFVVSSLLEFIRVEYERRQVKDAFGLYISPDFMKELTSDPDKLKLGGEIRDLSVMFTDIRSFTSISEGLSPEELIQLMNDFLTPMSDLVMQNRGTIDKYMGDAMMAFWNAPLDDAQHARNACITALGMQAALDPINEDVAAKAKEIGKEPVLLRAGIGINTGPCAVGNMGSKQRFAYSTLGDAVNLASRLEGQTKNYGVNILIGEHTYNAVTDFACLEMDLIQVKGKQEAVRIFALLGSEEMASENEFKALKEKHESMIALYRKGDFKTAQKEAKSCKRLGLYNLDIAYDLYIERCDEMIKNPPKNWDGVFVATSK